MYHYRESGLQNVWLANGYHTKKTANGKAVSIVAADQLHEAIGRNIARKGYMTGGELRFLRKELDLSQSRFGKLIGASEESVSLWERRGRVPKSACRIMQAIYLEKIDGNVKIKKLIEDLAELDRHHQEKVIFTDTADGWREAA